MKLKLSVFEKRMSSRLAWLKALGAMIVEMCLIQLIDDAYLNWA